MLTVEGKLESHPVKLLFDKKGDFDVITSAAVEKLEAGKIKVEYINDPENIPAYLKQQRNVKIQAINCRVGVRDKNVDVQPMILHGREPCVLLSRYSIEKFYRQLMKHGVSYTRRTLLAKGERKLQRWIEEDLEARKHSNDPSTSMSEEISKKSQRIPRKSSFSEEDTDVVMNSEDETSRRHSIRRIGNRKSYGETLTGKQMNSLWSSDEEASNEPSVIPTREPEKSLSMLINISIRRNVRRIIVR